MAQLIVRNVEDEIRDKLRELAIAHGRSMEEEVREILRAAVLRVELEPKDGLGSRIVARFRDCGLRDCEEIEEHKGQAARSADFGP